MRVGGGFGVGHKCLKGCQNVLLVTIGIAVILTQ